MAKNTLVISCDIRETRAALIENGIIAELHIERKGRQSSTVGNVYIGKVTRVLPGLQAAFIDIGQERAAFLHVEDLIRPDDFDEYLAGGRKLARGEGSSEGGGEGEEGEVEAEGEAAGGDAAEAAAAAAEALEAEENDDGADADDDENGVDASATTSVTPGAPAENERSWSSEAASVAPPMGRIEH